MNQRFPGKQLTQSPVSDAIPSPLQAALGSLNVSLEEELTRYRRHRQGLVVSPLKSYGVSPKNKAKDQESGLSSFQTAMPVSPSAEAVGESVETQPVSEGSEEKAIALASVDPKSTAVPEDRSLVTDPPPEDYLESSEELLRSLAEEEEEDPIPGDRQQINFFLSPLGIGSGLLLIVVCITFGIVLLNPALIQHLLPKGLLRSPDASPTSPNPSPPPSPHTSNPSEFGELTLDRLSTLKPRSALEAAPVVSKTTVPAPTAPPAPSPSGLNLRVLSLPVLPAETVEPQPELPPQEVYTAAVLPSPAPPSSQMAESLPQLQPAPMPPGVPDSQPSPTAPNYLQGFVGMVPMPVPTPPEGEWMPEPVAIVPPEPGETYYVIANYEDGSGLAKIQALIPDAYLRNFPGGIYVQLGAFADGMMAQALVDELKREGISARIYSEQITE